jgi:hypothetical protein
MGSNDVVVVQDTFERRDCRPQDRHAEHAFLPRRGLETLETFHSIPAGEPQRQILLVAAEKIDAKAAIGGRIRSLKAQGQASGMMAALGQRYVADVAPATEIAASR